MDLDIGKIIKEGRQQKRFTQYQLAEMVGVDPSTVSRWENNEKTPSGDTLIKMANLLNIVPELFPGYDRVPKTSDIPLPVHQELERLWRDNEKLWQVIRLLERTVFDRKDQDQERFAAAER